MHLDPQPAYSEHLCAGLAIHELWIPVEDAVVAPTLVPDFPSVAGRKNYAMSLL
jgi:hypothetical protein